MRLQACFVRSGVLLVLAAVGMLAFSACAFAETKTVTFLQSEGPEHSFEVPAGVTSVQVEAVGGTGGRAVRASALAVREVRVRRSPQH